MDVQENLSNTIRDSVIAHTDKQLDQVLHRLGILEAYADKCTVNSSQEMPILVANTGKWELNMDASIKKRALRAMNSHNSMCQLHALQLLNEYNKFKCNALRVPITLGELGQLHNELYKDKIMESKCDSSLESAMLYANSSVGATVPSSQHTLEDKQEHTQQTVSFNSPEQETMVMNDTFVDSTRMSVIDAAHTDLGKFLERPVIIDTRELEVGESIFPGDAGFYPWDLYLKSSPVLRKLTNYSYIRGTLHLKFQVNGGPTYYGRLLAAYDPYDERVTPRSRPLYESDPSLTRPVAGGLAKLSQRLHVLIDPCESQGGEMTCPCVCPFNYIDITTYDSKNGSRQGYTARPEQLGRIDFASFAALGSTGVPNLNSVGISIQTLAWMTDVTLAGPTEAPVISANSGLWANAGSKWTEDEYGKGIVSRPASAVARFAGYLEKVPVIGPFATATHIAAGAVSSVAKLFGFSKPIDATPVRKYKHSPVGNLATTDIDDSAEKLTFDTKQELSIDHNIIGKDCEDELTVSAIATKPSYVDSFDWSPTNDVNEVLARINVEPTTCPTHFYTFNGTQKVENFLSPLGFASLPFDHWKGGIRYRFMVNASKFHRGRIKITYEPRGNDTPPVQGSTNTRYTRIVDIGEMKDFYLDVNWMQNAPYKRVRRPTFPGDERLGSQTHAPRLGSVPIDNSSLLACNDDYDNGQIIIEVMTKLVSPLETDTLNNPITISWFISGLDDFEVAAPTSKFGKYTIPYCRPVGNLTANSGEYATAADSSLHAKRGNAHEAIALEPIGTPDDFPAQSLVHYGETFHSFRNMMKRYCYYEDVICPTRTGPENQELIFRHITSNYPKPYGPYRNFVGDYTSGSLDGEPAYQTNLAFTNLITYLQEAFVAKRGGIRWKYVYITDNTFEQQNSMVVRRIPLDDNAYQGTRRDIQVVGTVQTSYQPETLMAGKTNLFEGASFTPTAQNPALEIELPFYSPLRFFPPNSENDLYNRHEVAVEMHNVSNRAHDHIQSYVAAGEDFNLSWFVNAPSMHFSL